MWTGRLEVVMTRERVWSGMFVVWALVVGVPGVVAQVNPAETRPGQEKSEREKTSKKEDGGKEESVSKEDLPSVKEVMDKLDNLYRSGSSHGTMEMTIVNARGTRKLTLETWSKGEDDALVVIRAPAREAGTATLKVEEGLWNYAPRADRLIRIPSGLLSDSWMGSNFTNDDLVRETSMEKDYTTELAWVEDGGTRYLQATMTPKKGAPVVWDKVVYRMTADEWLPVDANYFDGGKSVRVMTFSDVKEMDGRRLPTVMELKPANKNESTRVEYKKLKFDVKVDDSLFSQQGLRRAARTK